LVTLDPGTAATAYTIDIAGAAPSGIDYLSISYCTLSSTSPAEFFVGANSVNTIGNTGVTFTATPASRTVYWVGGTGNWSDTARWSLASGGAGGEAVPRSLDNVIFNSASNATAYTATIDPTQARCAALTIAGPASGNVTIAGSGGLAVHGNATLPATGLTRTYTGAITLSGSSPGRTFTTNGVALASSITVNGVGCGWILGSALNNGSSNFTVTNGSFDTSASNYSIASGIFSSSNSNARTFTLNASTVGFATFTFFTSASLTFNAGTSQINLSSAATNLSGSGQTFYNVTLTSNTIGTHTITGANTFNNLTITAPLLSSGLITASISDNQTINGTLTCAGSSAVNRVFLRSSALGTVRTLTVNAISATNCDFRDITVAGAAAGSSLTRAGNCGGNSGITFPAVKTVYWNLAGSQNWTATAWATTPSGTPAVDNFPLAQDTAAFTDSGSVGTVNIQGLNAGVLDASACTVAMTLNYASALATFYGSHAWGSGVTVSGSSGITFSGRGNMTFISAGKTTTFPIAVDCATGTFQLGDTFNSSSSLSITRGTFNTANNNLTCTTLDSSNSVTRSITLGTSTINLIGTGNVWFLSNITGLTFSGASATINLTDTSATARTFAGGGLTYGTLGIGGTTGASTLSITENNTFAVIRATKTVAHTISLGQTTQRVGVWTVTGTAGNLVTVRGLQTNAPCALIYTGSSTVVSDYLIVASVRAYTLSNTWYAGTNSTNNGSLGWIFGAPPIPPTPILISGVTISPGITIG
jgi:hypothetical protein